MTNVYEMNPNEYNLKLAEALKKIPEFKQPDWSRLVKSGASKEDQLMTLTSGTKELEAF